MVMEDVMTKIEQYWDRRSDGFDLEHDTEDLGRWAETLRRLLGPDRGKSVLDLGTGTGFLANMTAAAGYPTVGVDVSKKMLEHAVRHAAQRGVPAVYMEGNVQKLPFLDGTFDALVNARLIWTVVEPDLCLREWFRVLKPGGALFCLNRMQPGVGLTLGQSNIYEDDEVNDRLTCKGADMEKLSGLLLRNGFTDVKITELPGLTRPEFDLEPWFVLSGGKSEEPAGESGSGTA